MRRRYREGLPSNDFHRNGDEAAAHNSGKIPLNDIIQADEGGDTELALSLDPKASSAPSCSAQLSQRCWRALPSSYSGRPESDDGTPTSHQAPDSVQVVGWVRTSRTAGRRSRTAASRARA